MAVISTSQYWKFRGSKIPPAFPLLEANATGKNHRETEFYTDVEAIEGTVIGHASRRNDGKYSFAHFVNRKEAFRRDRYTCTVCGYKSKRQKGDVNDLEAHHIDPQGGDGLANLQTVCLPCHQRLTTETAGGTDAG